MSLQTLKQTLFGATALLVLLGAAASQNVIKAQNSSSGESLEIGYVDPQAIMNKMPEFKAVQQELQNFAQRKRKELAEKRKNFQKQMEEFQQKSAVISEKAKKQEQQRLGKLNTELQKYQSQIQQELQKKQQELMEPLFSQIEKAIQKIAKERDLTYVLNTTTSGGDVIILYASDQAKKKYDITDAVMRELGI